MLAVDSICGLDVVLADGRLLHVNEADCPELFYAFRGAADSFGVIIRFHLRTVQAPHELVVFSYEIEGIVRDVNEATVAFLNLQRVVRDPDPTSLTVTSHSASTYMMGHGLCGSSL